MFKRDIFYILLKRLEEPRKFIQVIAGPRQVGKTTIVQQVAKNLSIPVLYASADEPIIGHSQWIEQQWDLARLAVKNTSPQNGVVLILDEIQKISDWSSTVKYLWDQDTLNQYPIKVVLLGSASLLIQHGLKESLAGRFEQIVATHWTFDEMREAFDWSLEQYLYFGGYPGSAGLIENESRWRSYVNDSLIETTITRDILLLNPINKPALLRQLFELACHYSGQILSYQKMVGQLQDVGNTTTLAHYLELLQYAGMVAGLQKYAGQLVRQRGSSPKLQVLNNALLSAQSHYSFLQAQKDRAYWGRLVESSIGAYLLNAARIYGMKIFYWREGNKEVDFIVQWHNDIIAFEVKSGMLRTSHSGLELFCHQFNAKRSFIIGSQTLSISDFLSKPLSHWFQ